MEKNSINRVLFDFNSIVDTDIGVALLMSKKYANPTFVNTKVIGKTIEEYKILMLNRRYINPLIFLLNSEFQGSEANSLYIELTTNFENYSEVLNMSITTAIFDMLKNSQSIGSMETAVLCWNSWQSDYIHSLIPNIETVVRDGDKPIDVEQYDTLILKYPYEINTFTCGTREMTGKNIYICKYRCNMNPDDISKLNVTNAIKLYSLNANEIYTIEVYADAKLDNVHKEEIHNGF